jgi:branched-chain amino acid transport system permease protein
MVVHIGPYIAMSVIFVILPSFFLSEYVQSMMTKFIIFAIFAVASDIAIGYTGLMSLGQGGFFGAGAYTVAILMHYYGIESFWIAAPLSILMSALIAAIFGIIALRVSGPYFIFVTFALGQSLFSLAWKWRWLSSEGIEGIAGLTFPSIGLAEFNWSSVSFYYFVLVIFFICLILLYRLTNSPFGHILLGIREGEPRMQALGYNTWLYKYFAFVISGIFCGIAGMLFAYHSGIVVPKYFGVSTSVLVFVMVILGGRGKLYGAIVGAAIIIGLEFYVGMLTPERWPLILGIVFVISVMQAREGIGVNLFDIWDRWVLIWKH